jgi:hypothetical protein
MMMMDCQTSEDDPDHKPVSSGIACPPAIDTGTEVGCDYICVCDGAVIYLL